MARRAERASSEEGGIAGVTSLVNSKQSGSHRVSWEPLTPQVTVTPGVSILAATSPSGSQCTTQTATISALMSQTVEGSHSAIPQPDSQMTTASECASQRTAEFPSPEVDSDHVHSSAAVSDTANSMGHGGAPVPNHDSNPRGSQAALTSSNPFPAPDRSVGSVGSDDSVDEEAFNAHVKTVARRGLDVGGDGITTGQRQVSHEFANTSELPLSSLASIASLTADEVGAFVPEGARQQPEGVSAVAAVKASGVESGRLSASSVSRQSTDGAALVVVDLQVSKGGSAAGPSRLTYANIPWTQTVVYGVGPRDGLSVQGRAGVTESDRGVGRRVSCSIDPSWRRYASG